jgi:hypothetical protein
MSKLIKGVIATVLMSLAFLGASKQARAGQTTNCMVYDVEFYSGNDATHAEQVMQLHCVNDGTNYRAYYGTNQDGCSALSVDQVKTYVNLLTAAHLAGKAVVVNWTAQTGTCFQTTIDAVFLSP